MNFYEDGLSRLFGLNPRKRHLKRAVGWTLIIASVVTPITFRHAIWDYSQRRTAIAINWYFDPMIKQLNAGFEKRMQIANRLQQQQQSQK
jgi:hypothetical protein